MAVAIELLLAYSAATHLFDSVAVSVAASIELLLAYSAAGKFSRASSAGGRRHLQAKFYKSDRVGRRGLSEPREDFPRLPTYAIPWLYPRL